jgi:hypothetical protein
MANDLGFTEISVAALIGHAKGYADIGGGGTGAGSGNNGGVNAGLGGSDGIRSSAAAAA